MITSPDVLDPLVALALNVLAAAVTLAVGWALAAYLERLVRTLTPVIRVSTSPWPRSPAGCCGRWLWFSR